MYVRTVDSVKLPVIVSEQNVLRCVFGVSDMHVMLRFGPHDFAGTDSEGFSGSGGAGPHLSEIQGWSRRSCTEGRFLKEKHRVKRGFYIFLVS